MPEKNDIPTFRNLDGVYYRVIRDGIHVNRCFSDLSEAEQDVIMAEYNTEQLRRLCRYLSMWSSVLETAILNTIRFHSSVRSLLGAAPLALIKDTSSR